MYSKQQASQLRENFWTSFGQYMRPLPGADGESVNWLNYKTGVKNIFFRMDVDQHEATIAIEITHPDLIPREECFNRFADLKLLFVEFAGADWKWQPQFDDEHGRPMSRISVTKKNVNIFNTRDWPDIISFLKPRIISLDKFWSQVKDHF